MANEVLVKIAGGPTVISFNVTGSFSPADNGTNWLANLTADTNVALTLNALADGAGRQSAKFDFGATMARRYALYGCVDYTGETPSATGRTDYYLLPSTSGTAGNSNVAGNSGSDAAAPDGALGSITLAEFKLMGKYIGSLFTHDGAAVQNGFVGVVEPPTRYAQLLVINEGGDAYEADDVEHHQVLVPLTDEVQ